MLNEHADRKGSVFERPTPRWDPRKEVNRWLGEITLMHSFATSEGRSIPPETAKAMAELIRKNPTDPATEPAEVLPKILEIHGALAALVAPATPRSIRATEDEEGGVVSWWDNKLIRYLILLAGLSLIAFFVSAIWTTFPARREVGWLAAAILGASFYNLFTAYKYILDRTFDPQYKTIYAVRYVLGVVSGFVLANFGDQLGLSKVNGLSIGGPLAALIGGYSSDAVNQILLRVSEILSAVVKGSGAAAVERRATSAAPLATSPVPSTDSTLAVAASTKRRAALAEVAPSAPSAASTGSTLAVVEQAAASTAGATGTTVVGPPSAAA
ncbi:MAG TPA: hypothetical protein VF516_02650 [Kofleriaceae bacterium]